MQTSISKRFTKHTPLRNLFTALLALSSLNHLAHAQSPIQPLQNDPAIRQQLNRKNYEPSNTPNPNNLFPFGGHRGTVEHRTGSIRITNNQTTQLGGGVELQQLNYKGEIGFHTRFTNHGWKVHSPFDEHASKTGYGKGQSISDGYGPSSYAYTIKGTMVHPADGYEAPQGGGYPTPSKYGAHDRYNIKVSGQARRMVQKPLDRNFGWKQAWENTKHAGRTGIENAIHAGRKMDTPLVTYDRNQGFWTNSQTNIRNMLGRMNGKIEGALLIPSMGLHTAVGAGSAAVDSYQYNRDYQNYKKDIQQQKNMDERTLFWHLYGMGEQYTQKQLGKEPLKQVGQDIAEKANNFAQKYPTTTEAAELGFNLWGAGVVGKNSAAAVARSGADDFAGAVAARAAQNGVQTGGRSAWDIYIAEKKIADAAYNTIRNRSDDVAKIAENTGIKSENIQKVKDHVFYDEHIKFNGTEIGRFDSDIDQANAWNRLINGTHTQDDITWLRHEAAERWYERNSRIAKEGNRIKYEDAHKKAEEKWTGNPWRNK